MVAVKESLINSIFRSSTSQNAGEAMASFSKPGVNQRFLKITVWLPKRVEGYPFWLFTVLLWTTVGSGYKKSRGNDIRLGSHLRPLSSTRFDFPYAVQDFLPHIALGLEFGECFAR